MCHAEHSGRALKTPCSVFSSSFLHVSINCPSVRRKGMWECGGVAPLFHDVYNRCWSLVSFMPLPLTPYSNDPGPELIWTFRTGQIYRLPQTTVLPVSGNERRLFSSARGLVTIVTELTRFHFDLNRVNTYEGVLISS